MNIYLLDRNEEMINAWVRVFQFEPDVEIYHDDFKHFMDTHPEIDGIVSPANSFGLMDGGYDKAIIDYLGENAQTHVLNMLDIYFTGYQVVGTAAAIPFGKYRLIHTPTMRTPESIIDDRVIFDCMLSCLKMAENCKVKNLVIPAFGGCTGKVNKKAIAEYMHFAYKVFKNPHTETMNWGYANHIGKTLKGISKGV